MGSDAGSVRVMQLPLCHNHQFPGVLWLSLLSERRHKMQGVTVTKRINTDKTNVRRDILAGSRRHARGVTS
jgi:hypothetical protein